MTDLMRFLSFVCFEHTISERSIVCYRRTVFSFIVAVSTELFPHTFYFQSLSNSGRCGICDIFEEDDDEKEKKMVYRISQIVQNLGIFSVSVFDVYKCEIKILFDFRESLILGKHENSSKNWYLSWSFCFLPSSWMREWHTSENNKKDFPTHFNNVFFLFSQFLSLLFLTHTHFHFIRLCYRLHLSEGINILSPKHSSWIYCRTRDEK